MTQNRAREARSPEGCWRPCRQPLAGPASREEPLTCGQAHRSGGCSVPLCPRLSLPGQLFYQIDSRMALCPPTALILYHQALAARASRCPHPSWSPMARAG